MVQIQSFSANFKKYWHVRAWLASRPLAVSAHAPGNEDSPDDTAGVYDDWLMVLLAETGSYRFV